MHKLILFLSLTGACSAADWSSIYDSAKIKAEQPRLQIAIDAVIQKEIEPFIPTQEATLFGLQPIDLPLEGFRSNPLDFYAQSNHIILPARTLLFMEDLSRAYGWMWANRFSTRTIDEYLLMLRYRTTSDFPDKRYPPPLQALHIPDNALSDHKVVEASVRLRRTAYAFILLHEFAHLQLHHEQGKSGFSEAQEEDADRYALNLVKENSITPTGVFLVMYSSMLFENGPGSALHPVTPQRLQVMSHYMDEHVLEFVRGRPDKTPAMDGIHSIALLLAQASEWSSIHAHRQDLEELAMKTDPSTLQPRPLPRTTR